MRYKNGCLILGMMLAAFAFILGNGIDANAQAKPEETSAMLNLNTAVVVTPTDLAKPEQKAVAMLLEEVEKRSRIRWSVAHEWPKDGKLAIVLGKEPAIAPLAGPLAAQAQFEPGKGAEGYRIKVVTDKDVSAVLVAGNDPRGVLFGVGRLLRELRMTRDSITIPATFTLNTAPQIALRGHQLGYRPKVNTYDGWTLPMFEQYFRDLVVFGTNAIEFIPPKSDDAPDSPHFPIQQIDMMRQMSQLADDYGISVWIWYPAMAKDNSDPKTIEQELKDWGDVFAQLPRIDAVFVPGGDPGDTQPKYLMALLEKQTEVLHRTHPQAQMWVSPQGFTEEWMNEFLQIMQTKPKWLSGIVFAPQTRQTLPDFRKAIPSEYPIRHYPDITHSYCCQYPLQDWDMAYKLTQDREVINPRPIAQSKIFQWSRPYTCGFISYSEGCNDDVNKILWSALGWNPDADVTTVLREYARYFIDPGLEDGFAQALLSLEKNWEGALLTNTGVDTTLQQVQAMERTATPQVLLKWRFQHVVYRAYYDAFVRRRLQYETELESRAMEMLARAESIGASLAISQADAILDDAVLKPVGQELRSRVSDMAEALYQSIHMQLSVPRYKAIGVGRGANFDLIDKPLNNRLWLKASFAKIRENTDEAERFKGINEILNWTNPGLGGFYDDLGDPTAQPHLVRNMTKDFDPEFKFNPLMGYRSSEPRDKRLSWYSDAETRYEAPLKMRYEGLDPTAQYKLRAVYAGDKMDAQMRLVANDSQEIHPLIAKENPVKPVEFDIPKEATAKGDLTLTWNQEAGRGGGGRGCQIAEVWLIKK